MRIKISSVLLHSYLKYLILGSISATLLTGCPAAKGPKGGGDDVGKTNIESILPPVDRQEAENLTTGLSSGTNLLVAKKKLFRAGT